MFSSSITYHGLLLVLPHPNRALRAPIQADDYSLLDRSPALHSHARNTTNSPSKWEGGSEYRGKAVARVVEAGGARRCCGVGSGNGAGDGSIAHAISWYASPIPAVYLRLPKLAKPTHHEHTLDSLPLRRTIL